MKLGMIIPFINEQYIHELLDDIFKNDSRPDTVLLIDNRTDRTQSIATRSAAVEIYQPKKPITVNEAWNYGIDFMINTRKCDLVSVFNDDLRLEKWFFEKLRACVANPKHSQIGVFVPETCTNVEGIKMSTPEVYVTELKRREGWAWTIRTEVAKQVPTIPTDQLGTFCGDDWYYVWCERFGRPWAKMIGVRCFHYIGASMKTEQGKVFRAKLKSEKQAFDSLI